MKSSRLLLLAFTCAAAVRAQDPLPSWSDGAAKKGLLDFVARVTKEGGPEFVAPSERIAVFDNDGTLWCEQPVYVQFAFAMDRVRALAPKHPDWKEKQPFKAVLENDARALAATGERGLVEIMMASHAGMTTDEFAVIVSDWIATAKHPKLGRPYTELVYQPMLEVLAFLRRSGFKTFIVSGGGVEFMRVWSERVYGVPPEQVVGSVIKTRFVVRDGKPVLERLAEVDFVDDKDGKPIGIHKAIGRKPTMAFGNSDGDFEMLQWTKAAPGPRFALLVHHDDAEREWAYDRDSHIGKLARALDEAGKLGFVVASMKKDFKTVFPR